MHHCNDSNVQPKVDVDHQQHVSIRLWNKSGQDVIVIDRRDQTLVLFIDPDRAHKPSDVLAKNGISPIAAGGGLFSPLKSPVSQSSPSKRPDCSRSSVLGLDCRYKLASQLNPDSLFALQDAMEEVRNSSNHDDQTFEMCTLISKKWVYAYRNGDKELYALFDSSVFVTLANVQSAAIEIRKELVGISEE
jgi:hypothetical protein